MEISERIKGRELYLAPSEPQPGFNDATTYRSNFPNVTPEPLYQHPKREYEPNPAKLEGSSVYSEQFGAKELPRVQPYMPAYNPPSGAKFEGTSTYNSSYAPVQPEPLYQRPKREYVPNPAKLEGQSGASEN